MTVVASADAAQIRETIGFGIDIHQLMYITRLVVCLCLVTKCTVPFYAGRHWPQCTTYSLDVRVMTFTHFDVSPFAWQSCWSLLANVHHIPVMLTGVTKQSIVNEMAISFGIHL